MLIICNNLRKENWPVTCLCKQRYPSPTEAKLGRGFPRINSEARRQHFMKLTLGDWSGDGHARHEDFFLLSNYDIHRIHSAYKESCKRTGIIFHSAAGARYYNLLPGIDLAEEPWREVWGEYNENWICPEAERILLNDGVNYSKRLWVDLELREANCASWGGHSPPNPSSGFTFQAAAFAGGLFFFL